MTTLFAPENAGTVPFTAIARALAAPPRACKAVTVWGEDKYAAAFLSIVAYPLEFKPIAAHLPNSLPGNRPP